MTDNAPFFVIGAGRSGTTLLRLVLTGHSRLHVPPETWFVRPLVERLPLTAVLDPAQVAQAVALMTQHERWPDMEFSAAALQEQAAGLVRPTLGELVTLVYRHLLQGSGKARLGDKTPHYSAIVPELAALYPAAKFIHLVRDGRDVAISWIDAGWQRYYEPDFGWTLAMAHRRRYRAAGLADRVLEVRYEDLVRDPERVARLICDFLGELFEPAMLAWRERTQLVVSRDRHLHGRLQQPLSDDAIAVWQRRLSAGECFATEACLHPDLLALGYSLRFGARGWRPIFSITAGSLRAAAPLLRRGIPYLQKRRLLPAACYL